MTRAQNNKRLKKSGIFYCRLTTIYSDKELKKNIILQSRSNANAKDGCMDLCNAGGRQSIELKNHLRKVKETNSSIHWHYNCQVAVICVVFRTEHKI